MSTTSRPPVPIAMAFGGTTSEEGRAFYQTRLALFGKWVFWVSGAFLAFVSGMRLLGGLPFSRALLFHGLGTLLAGVVWARARWTAMSGPVLELVDALGTWVICASFAMMALGHANAMRADPAQALYIGLLAGTYILIVRAIAVPSTAGRTAWVSVAAMVPLALVGAVVMTWSEPTLQVRTMAVVDVASWQIAAIAMSSVASRVIFGLRQEVSEVRKLGQYTLENKIGEGGMGIVYRARHAMLKRPTAIKLLPREKAGDEDILRFEREVQLTAGLSHPNTVAIFDYGRTADGIFYYAMEYLDGLNLDQLVAADGPQPAARVVHILRQVAGALAEAHEVGLVHRDVKPANIILCQRGGMADVAKVVDFGLVKRFRPVGSGLTTTLSVETRLIGTPLYMAPENFSTDGHVDARSDLYALGAVAYLLLTGTPVFVARTVLEVCSHHLHETPEPPSHRLGGAVPAELERLVLRCLAKSPDDRPQSARALGKDLDRYATADPWSNEEAATWWTHYRAQQAGHPSETAASAVGDGADDVRRRADH